MSSEAQIIANRRNSQKSTGPRSPEGKAVVSQNAVKHGLFALEAVISGESRADFDIYRNEMLSELAPVGPMESMLAERIISLSWRLKRLERMQNQAIDVMIERDGPNPLTKLAQSLLPKDQRQVPADASASNGDLVLGRVAIKDYSNSRVLDRLLMYERRIENSMFKTIEELRRLRLIRELQEANAVDEEFGEDIRTTGNQDAGNQQSRQSGRADLITRYSDNHCQVARCPGADYNYAKQSQFAPAQMNVNSFVGERYENNSRPGLRENKAKQSQFHAPAPTKGVGKGEKSLEVAKSLTG